jgi:hypothetical protein
MKARIIGFRPPPLNDAEPGVDAPIIGTWAASYVEAQRPNVDFERIPVLFTPDGKALVRRAGF